MPESGRIAPPPPARQDPSATPLDVLRFPLHGSRLIEASAGTGKTFTIATLYVRLVLGHGADAGFERPLMPPQILVVTFTEAATQELRDRIRARLAEAAAYFLDDPAAVAERPPGQDTLHDLRADYPPESWAACARKLQLAVEWMDEAAVSTIHGWCNRMLREHAFDSNSLFQQTLEQNTAPLMAEVVRDYWRAHIAPLDAISAAEVRAWWPGPDELQAQLMPVLRFAPELKAPGRAGMADGLDDADIVGDAARIETTRNAVTAPDATGAAPAAGSPCDLLRATREHRLGVLGELKRPWQDWLPELRQLFDDGVAGKRVNGRQIQARYYLAWLENLRAWCEDPDARVPQLTDTAWLRLGPGLNEAWKGDPPDHPAFAALAELRQQTQALPEARHDVLRHAADWVSRRFAGEQAQRAQMSFDALLDQLDAALAGPSGATLADTLRKQFPVALIDEFQDTDPVQYRIFDAVYRVADNAGDSALILIGDPKQAIYGFRGADIYTYLRARAAVDGRLYVLGRNFRSTRPMVDAVNHCFLAAERRQEGEGAFLFRRAGGNPVPFIPVQANDRPDRLVVADAAAPALTLWWLPRPEDGKSMGAGAYVETMADACAGEIARLLTLSQQGRAGFVPRDAAAVPAAAATMPVPPRPAPSGAAGPSLGRVPLHPADIAVLVDTGRQARAVRRALSRRGVRSVYLSERQSVFASAQAGEIEFWLRACAEPDDPRALRAALATPTLGVPWQDLDRVGHDELEWEARVQQFRGYARLWREKGVLPMLRRLLDDFGVPARQLAGAEDASQAGSDGERVMTDILHIAELLQQASAQLDGEHALLRHLAEMRHAAGQGDENDALTIRLESDADLVRVITVHKSKGLEYPLVFLPYAAAFRPVRQDAVPLSWHDEQGQLKVSLVPDAAGHVRADRERLGEDLRKLYVALTRARYAAWVGVAPVANLEASALGYLIGQGLTPGEPSLPDVLETFRAGHADIALGEAPAPFDIRYRADTAAVPAGRARTMRRAVRDPWWIASYSSLRTARPGSAIEAEPETAREDVFLEAAGSDAASEAGGDAGEALARPLARAPTLAGGLEGGGLLHAFPAGAQAGTFFHELLEWAAAQGFAAIAGQPEVVRDAVARRCQVRNWSAWTDGLTAWLMDAVTRSMSLPDMPGGPVAPVALAGVGDYIAEMEFWLGADNVDVALLDRIVRAHTLDRAERPVLEPARINGMLKGFIDLVFEHQGRYYVLDYKSNRLGNDDTAYTQAAMRDAILGHRYELQYALYLFALHRLLRARLPDYDYDRHVGGAAYVFLRGTHSAQGGVFAERPPVEMMHALDRLFATAHARKEAA
ncbi:exodeoxyribonuclease V subunit beta [Bordetella sp. H567]|uniref:exodeoxyribonuclease V subunit beta n=1 Tax=Bordetella sp. H567 TaxID=1697043 RepID=UPI00081D10C4|nr:exodeoxyribonuclease V subunit beta [Bordetella sp. H567]AOB29614.1 exodeoxyribonuclease V subunit beta [Bordetella sp. H567]